VERDAASRALARDTPVATSVVIPTPEDEITGVIDWSETSQGDAQAHGIRRWRLASSDTGNLSYRCATVIVMAVRKKRSISMPPDLDAEIAQAAADEGMSYSAWLAEIARKEFTIRAGLAAVSQFEQDHGAFTAEELSDAEQWAAAAVERAGQTGEGI
jgi:hypothetical protein